jgi:hypothetical protein
MNRLAKSGHAFVNAKRNRAQGCVQLAIDVFGGLKSLWMAILLILQNLPIIWQCFLRTPLVVLGVLAFAGILQGLCYPLSLMWRPVLFSEALHISSLVALASLRFISPTWTKKVFFEVLALRDQELHDKVAKMKVVRGVKAQLRMLVWLAVAGTGLAILVGFAAVHIVFLWWFWVIVIPVACVGGVALALLGYANVFLDPLAKLWRYVDPLAAIAVVIAVMFGVLSSATVLTTITKASLHYYASYALTLESLWQYSQREELKEWEQFRQRHKHHCIGFGIPLFLALQIQPYISVCLLQFFVAASASLLVDLFAKDKIKSQNAL